MPEHHQQPPTSNLTSTQVALGPMRTDLLPLYQRWSNDVAVVRTMVLAGPLTAEALTQTYNFVAQDNASASFTIYDRAT